MLGTFLTALPVLPLALLLAVIPDVLAATNYTAVCESLSTVISSSSSVYYPGQPSYIQGIYHPASSSSQQSACVVEPGTGQDISSILEILAQTRTPFAVKGGGHATNPGFSSTLGVQISMSRFSQVTYDASSQTATIGAGLTWDQVYAALEPHGVCVVGGRVSGVGVAGFTLGGGYSWFTNQYGLTVDTVKAFELVLPTGALITATATSYSDVFFGLKGGGNNFGIVTNFILQTHQQSKVWGGLIINAGTEFDKLNAAIEAFVANVDDPKAQILPSYTYAAGLPIITNIIFYDGPHPPQGIFDEFLAIPSISSDVKTRSLTSLVDNTGSHAIDNLRTFFNTVAVKEWTPSLLNAIVNETLFWGSNLVADSALTIFYDVEPFLPNYLAHTDSRSAWPPSSARSPGTTTFPLNLIYAWSLSAFDQDFYEAISASAAHLESLIVQEQGSQLNSAPLYPNYAIYGTSLQEMYGENVDILEELAMKYDPEGVMKLAGGFKF